ncbi:hypothetical protein GPZ77_34470 (plasmid) [Streptomyces sp. QHH-9511]|uniref:hypothetical protein n=1 Tax=Streptomyces sp. QHH-9511 TaxID=2684468 RepID=UPI0013181CA2|nr:hypothetical protein [Streptomyces sp. QHH-9511]QGZ53337.1 hypothetical protein GPZ77_34470 [Streptomyces sp. QHH-9511]
MFAVCVTRDPDAGLNAGKAKPLYDLLVSFSDVSSRDTGQGYPYRETLATALDCSKQTVDRAGDYLENEIGLVKIHRRKVEGKPDENDANLYEIFDAWLIHGVTPPAGTPPQLVARYGHTIPGLDVDAWVSEHAPDFDLVGWHSAYDEKLRAQQAKREEQRRKERARRKKPKKGGGVMDEATPEGAEEDGGSVTSDATGGVTGDVTGGVMGDALSRAGTPEPSFPDEQAPFGGVAPNERRRPTTGSRGAGSSGSAASGKNSARLSRAQRDQVQAVRDLLPPDLDAALGNRLPPNVSVAVLDALATGQPRERTAQQLVKHRVLARWNGYWAERFYAGQLPAQPYGPLLAMLKDTGECGSLACDDRVDVHTGEGCVSCVMRAEDRRADREAACEHPPVSDPARTLPSQRQRVVVDHSAGSRPECDGCGRWLPADATVEVCADCRVTENQGVR